MGPEGIILVNPPITTIQQSLTHSALIVQVDNCPIDGRVSSNAGERRTCIFTLQSHKAHTDHVAASKE